MYKVLLNKVQEAFEYYEYITGKSEMKSPIDKNENLLSLEEIRQSLKEYPSISEQFIAQRFRM